MAETRRNVVIKPNINPCHSRTPFSKKNLIKFAGAPSNTYTINPAARTAMTLKIPLLNLNKSK